MPRRVDRQGKHSRIARQQMALEVPVVHKSSALGLGCTQVAARRRLRHGGLEAQLARGTSDEAVPQALKGAKGHRPLGRRQKLCGLAAAPHVHVAIAASDQVLQQLRVVHLADADDAADTSDVHHQWGWRRAQPRSGMERMRRRVEREE